ncbi:hypothetical protein [uncultured Bacteroides sp.]|uniref:hypothetical protein n=1 Tax=uncultured Bacteroides sp. TaxID=162156 RepID=UPI0025ED853E|nr:hypothetical protein [uncultured Bacteroides sp.]
MAGEMQKFITDFYKQYNDTKAFEAAILELVLDKQKEQYTLILNSLRTEMWYFYSLKLFFSNDLVTKLCQK